MIKVMIVDDEYLVIESIKFIVEKYMNGIEIIETARSGREAIEKTLVVKPDVIFMDIRMPGINGIEAIRQIKANYDDTTFVIITAYEYFEYAKEAVNLGVQEYLLKPLNKNRIIEALKAISERISLKRASVHREMILKEKINKIIPHMEGQFVYTQLLNGETNNDRMFYEEVFDMKLAYGYVIIGMIRGPKGRDREENLRESLNRQKFYDVFSLELKSIGSCLIGPPLLDRAVAFIPNDEGINDYSMRNQAIKRVKKLIERIDERVKVNYKIGVGRCYDIDNLRKSYNEAYIAASFSNHDRLIHFEDVLPSLSKVDDYPTNKEKKLIHKVVTSDLSGTLEEFEEIFTWLLIYYGEDLDKIKSKLIELMILIRRSIPYELNEKTQIEEGFLVELLKIKHLKELKMSYLNYLKIIIEKISQSKEQELSGLISGALNYIQQHYHRNISLDDIAQEMNMSYHYFSKFFKESVGKNFVDYLTELRIEKSTELLEDPKLSVKEICFDIGYSDPNYFSKLFKKITGMSPTDYRSLYSSKDVVSS